MTVIKFTDEQSKGVIKPGINNAISRVFDAVVKYCLKENLPEYADRDELIFTTDTHEFFRGNGKGLDLIAFNTVLVYESTGDFPETGLSTKIYVDKSSALMFIWNGTNYQSMAGGDGGEIIISPSDAKIGDLATLKTTNKTTVVAAINEVFNALAVIDVSAINTQIANIKVDVSEVKSALSGIDLTAIADLEVAIGDLGSLTTAQKASIVEAINELKKSVDDLKTSSADTVLDQVNTIIGALSSLSTANKTNVVAAINEVLNKTSANTTSITGLLGSVESLEAEVVSINGSVTVLQTTVESLDASIAQINKVIGALTALNTSNKTSIVAAINELVAQVGSLNEFAADLTAIEAAIGTLANLDTAQKSSLVLAINELVVSITGIDGQIDQAQTDLAAVKSTVENHKSSISTLSTRTNELETRVASIEDVNLTAEDKENYKIYSDQVQALLDGMVPELQGRISLLEQKVASLQSQIDSGAGSGPGDGGDGGGDPGGEPTDPQIVWEHEFVVPVGIATYELGNDPVWTASGNTMDLMEDLYGDAQKVHLYSLGNAANAPTAPVEVPLVGMPGTAPTPHGVWESYTGTDVVFEAAHLIAWRFKLVKYA